MNFLKESLCFLAIAAIVTTVAPPAAAQAMNRVYGSVDVLQRYAGVTRSYNNDRFDRYFPGTLSGGISDSFFHVYSAAGPGYAKTNTYAEYQKPSNNLGSADDFTILDASGLAEFTLTDVVLSGAPGSLITTSMNVHVTGFRDLVTIANPVTLTPSVFSAATVAMAIVINDHNKNIGDGYNQLESINGGAPTMLGSGLLAAFDGDDVVTTGLFTVEANVPFRLTMRIESVSRAGFSGDSSGIAYAISDFGRTLTFASDRPVFNDLPVGTTASSVSAGIVNNQFSGLVTVVPEANTLALLGLALPIFGAVILR
ncbi:MAG: hypothetical protein H7145_05055, partial [Akkermansiaceae bacterium]|nr:hypothetical protein [Armatimonadota bacterium]